MFEVSAGLLQHINDRYGAHYDHQSIFNNGYRTHGQVKHRAEAGTLYLPFIQYTLQYTDDAHGHHHQGDYISYQRFKINSKSDTQKQFDKGIDNTPSLNFLATISYIA
jgi:hypothetical protein